jgi:hypothetical protein
MNQIENNKLMDYYRRAMEASTIDPDAAVNNARKAAERVCKNIIDKAGKKFDQHATIEALITQITNKGSNIKVNPKLILAIRTIQVYANYGAHDQSFQTEESLGHDDDLSNEDIIPCLNALTVMLKTYMQSFVDENMSDFALSIDSYSMNDNFVLKIGATNLTVPDSIMQGWQIEELFSKLNIKTQRIQRKWNDQILSDIADNTLDMAIYNKESTLRYLERYPDAGIHILRDVCSSMGGRNFYILASNEGRWKDMTFQQFKEALAPGVMIAVSKNSDMEKNLLFILDKTIEDLTKLGVKLIDYHSDQGLTIFEMNPDILVIGGQDLRFLAEIKGGYTEVVSYENLPVEKKNFFDKNSVNSIIVGDTVYKMCSHESLDAIVNQLMINFYSSNISEESRKLIRNKLRPQVRLICDNDETADYIIRRIMFETYRFF